MTAFIVYPEKRETRIVVAVIAENTYTPSYKGRMDLFEEKMERRIHPSVEVAFVLESKARDAS